MKNRIRISILVIALSGIMGCASVGTKYKWESVDKVVCKRNKFFIRGKECVTVKKAVWVPVERYRCSGTGCKVEFESGGKMEGGKFMDMPDFKVQN